MRVWDALFGGLSFLYVFAFGRRLAGPVCGFVAVFVLFVYGPLLFEHGLRNNNMEAPLVLCYCGGVYHFLAWATAGTPARRRGHVVAVMLFFFLGFMTKFVAAFFLPVVLVAASLLHRDTRSRVAGEWKLVGGGRRALLRAGRAVVRVPADRRWRRALAHHARRPRRRAVHGLDRSEPHPSVELLLRDDLPRDAPHGDDLADVRRDVLLLVRLVRERRLEELLVSVVRACRSRSCRSGRRSSITTRTRSCRRWHWPPATVRGGSRSPVAQPVDAVMARCQPAIHRAARVGPARDTCSWASPGVATLLAVATLVLGQVQLQHRRRAALSQLARLPSGVCRLRAGDAGRARCVQAARLMVPIAVLVVVVPAQAYDDTQVHLQARGASHAIGAGLPRARPRAGAGAAGRPAPGIYAIREQKWMLHSHFYYFRRLAPWERGDELDDRAVSDGLFAPGSPAADPHERHRLSGVQGKPR